MAIRLAEKTNAVAEKTANAMAIRLAEKTNAAAKKTKTPIKPNNVTQSFSSIA